MIAGMSGRVSSGYPNRLFGLSSWNIGHLKELAVRNVRVDESKVKRRAFGSHRCNGRHGDRRPSTPYFE